MPVTVNSDMPTVRYMPYATQVQPHITASTSVTWSAADGTISPSTGTSAFFTPPNKTKVVRITGDAGGGDTNFVDIQVYATIPIQPNWGFEQDWDNKTLRSEAEDGTAKLRRKGPIKRNWQFAWNNVDSADWIILREFFKFHQKDLQWYYEDLGVPDNTGSGEANILVLGTFDSGLKVTVAGPQRFNITTAFREA